MRDHVIVSFTSDTNINRIYSVHHILNYSVQIESIRKDSSQVAVISHQIFHQSAATEIEINHGSTTNLPKVLYIE